MSNLDIWNAVKQAPKTALKTIEFGYLKGKSDINPQWRIQAMTEQFGVVGHGWTYRIVRTWSEACTDGTVMCFTEVAVKTKINGEWGEEFSGIGGSAIVKKTKNGIVAEDEGYKKSTTDALGVAFKAVGVAADIYLGNFDGSKYKDEPATPIYLSRQQIGKLHKEVKKMSQSHQDSFYKKYPDLSVIENSQYQQILQGVTSSALPVQQAS